MRRERGATQRYCITVIYDPVNRMLSTTGANCLYYGYFQTTYYNFGTRQFLDQSITFYVIGVSVTADENLNVFKLKAQFGNSSLNDRD